MGTGRSLLLAIVQIHLNVDEISGNRTPNTIPTQLNIPLVHLLSAAKR